MYTKKLITFNDGVEPDDYDKQLLGDLVGLPYKPPEKGLTGLNFARREENPIVFFEISSKGGRRLRTGDITSYQILGKLYFELRKDLLPVAVSNFVSLVAGTKGRGEDGVNYHYKGIRIHRVIKNLFFQSGDLLDAKGECSRSIYNSGGLFRDEHYLLRHTGPGCISYCNRGPDTNGSLFQVCFTQNADLDNRYIVFGCLASNESYDILTKINSYGTDCGEPLEEIRIEDCGIAWEP